MFKRLIKLEEEKEERERVQQDSKPPLSTSLYLLAIPSGILLIIALIAHGFALAKQAQPLGGNSLWWVTILTIIFFVPAVFQINRVAKSDQLSMDEIKQLFQYCPEWLRGVSVAAIAYAVISFLILFYSHVKGLPPTDFESAPPIVFQGVSGIWLAVYLTSVSVLYSASFERL